MKMVIKKEINEFKRNNGFSGHETMQELQWYQLKKIDDTNKKIDKLIDDNNLAHGNLYEALNKKVSISLFKWIIGGLTGFFIILLTAIKLLGG